MNMTPLDPRWQKIAFDSWLLGCEAGLVIWLRMGRLAMGDAGAMSEARLMVDEKVKAAFDLQWKALSGGLGASPETAARRSVSLYRRKVGANRRRRLG
jgi:hypothetical protein